MPTPNLELLQGQGNPIADKPLSQIRFHTLKFRHSKQFATQKWKNQSFGSISKSKWIVSLETIGTSSMIKILKITCYVIA